MTTEETWTERPLTIVGPEHIQAGFAVLPKGTVAKCRVEIGPGKEGRNEDIGLVELGIEVTTLPVATSRSKGYRYISLIVIPPVSYTAYSAVGEAVRRPGHISQEGIMALQRYAINTQESCARTTFEQLRFQRKPDILVNDVSGLLFELPYTDSLLQLLYPAEEQK